MKRNFILKETGEKVQVVHTQFGRCRVRLISRPKHYKNGNWLYRVVSLKRCDLEPIPSTIKEQT